MEYLDALYFPSEDDEWDFFMSQKKACYDSYYPFNVFPQKGLRQIDFADITILYGGNGSGKSTILNVLAGLIEAKHGTVYNRSCFFETFLSLCKLTYYDTTFKNKAILTSDGVFDSMIDIRNLNQGIEVKREELFEEYARLNLMSRHNLSNYPELKKEFEEMMSNPIEHIDKLRKWNQCRGSKKNTSSKFARRHVGGDIREYSNGESAFEYFVSSIKGDGIYLLDEPENSLSPERQLELVKELQSAARFLNCQLVIATHSPFVLSLKGAKIYDLDAYPVDLKKWTELSNVRKYFDFFMDHKDEFD